jgi:2-dehydro-3-deoxyphosphooctonate aldolase (KDO 8-P synthase)
MDESQAVCHVGPITIGSGSLALIAGPCLAESLQLCMDVAGTLVDLCRSLGVPYVFKASYDKANRSSIRSDRGPGLERGLDWLGRVRDELGVPVITDVHEPDQAPRVAEAVDALQVPAFLCRQTDLLVAAARTGKAVNVKKGQFLAPWDMKEVAGKLRESGASDVMFTERGTSFGYNRLVTDFRSLPILREFAPVVFDATHSTQEPGGLGSASGGQRRYAPMLARAACACGVDALFIETHPTPDEARSDAACQLTLSQMPEVLERCLAVRRSAGTGN